MHVRSTVLGLFAISLCAARGLGAAPAVEEKPLGTAASYDAVKAVTFSSDSRRMAFLAVKGDRQYVVRDGVESDPYEWVIADSLAGPFDLSRLAYIVQTGNNMSAVVDGKTVAGGYYTIGADRITFSENAKHFAFTARRGNASKGDAVVVLDGVEGKPYQLAAVVPTFSPDGLHLAYSASPADGKTFMVLDGKEQKTFDTILPGTTVFSPDSKHLAYTATAGGKFVATIDGVPSQPYDAMRLTPTFSPDSAHVIYIAGKNNQFFVVSDGVEGPKYDAFTDGSIAYSPDSKHLAYAARKGKQWVLNVDGKEQQTFDAIAGASIRYSPDSAQLAYVAVVGERRVVILDGKQKKDYDRILFPGPIFSPDSKRLAFAGAHGDRLAVVVDDVEGPVYDNVTELTFTPDSKHFCYRALKQKQAMVVYDGKESTPFDNTTHVALSPDSNHWAFAATTGSTTSLWLDGANIAGGYKGWVNGSVPTFADPATANFLLVKGEAFVRVQLKLPQGKL